MILLVFFTQFLMTTVLARASSCCSSIRDNATCRRYCQQLLAVNTTIQQMQQLLLAAEHCPHNLKEFWTCLNSSLSVIRDIEVWPGRLCCDLGLSPQCVRKCQTAESKIEVRKSCSTTSERLLFTCLRKQEDGEPCCKQSTSLSCSIVCRSIYMANTPRSTRTPIKVVMQHCGGSVGSVSQCIQRQTQPPRATNPVDNLPCCEHSKTTSCRDTCLSALQSTKSEDDIIDELIVACSGPDLREPLWQCFLQTHTSPSNHTPPAARLDNAKLQCCAKAVTSRCRELCIQTYQTGWSYHTEFHQSCSYMQPVSTIEVTMHKCLFDVDEPCQLGCNGLTYCTNFNHRPTELFRSCNRDADYAAEKAFGMWENDPIRLPQMVIPVKDVRTCEPEKWKAIACALQIKPCHKQSSLLSLCKEDCLDILNQCVDMQKLGTEQSVPQLCNTLPSIHTVGACVPLSHYVRRSPYNVNEGEVTHPCNPSPCRADQICEIRRRKCKHDDTCQPFICKPACSLGKVSSMMVPAGSYVRIPNTAIGTEDQDCFLGCRCDSKGLLEHCKPLMCLHRKQCILGQGNQQEHGSHFLLDESECICHDGRLICSHLSCLTENQNHLSGSLNGCHFQYNPVCGSNGKTYPNSCLARCAGVTEFMSASSCYDYKPCHASPCKLGEMCVPRHQVCLGQTAQHNCPQYQCVDAEGVCNPHFHDPVCDTTGEEYTNACLLLSHHRTIAYRGHCQHNCSKTGAVCGHNGETYSSECAALAAGTSVDYPEPCLAVGNFNRSNQLTASCSKVKCPSLQPSHCQGIIPPGACCPICAAQLQVLFDQQLIGFAAEHIHQGPLTVGQIVQALSRLLMVTQCDVFGYLSLGGDLVLLIVPLVASPSNIQVEACNSEAERIESLIGSRSPTLVSYLELSPLLFASAHTVHFEHMESLYTVGSSAAHVTLLWTAFLCTVISSHLLLALSFHSISSYN